MCFHPPSTPFQLIAVTPPFFAFLADRYQWEQTVTFFGFGFGLVALVSISSYGFSLVVAFCKPMFDLEWSTLFGAFCERSAEHPCVPSIFRSPPLGTCRSHGRLSRKS